MRGEQATICRRKDLARQECRALLADELQSLRSLLDDVNFDGLSSLPLPGRGVARTYQEFVWLNKNSGRRVFASNLDRLNWGDGVYLKEQTSHEKIDRFLQKLRVTGEYELRYALKEKIKELETLATDGAHPVMDVCGQGDEIRALVGDDGIERTEKLKWRVIRQGKIAEESDQPLACPILGAETDIPEETRRSIGYQPPTWQMKGKSGVVLSVSLNDQQGLWLFHAGQEPKLIAQGYYQESSI